MNQLAIANPFSGITLQGSTVDNTTLGAVITKLLPYLYSLGALLLLIYLVVGGLQLMMSKGNPQAVEMGKTRITNALIGFILLIASYLLVKLIGTILGVSIVTAIFK